MGKHDLKSKCNNVSLQALVRIANALSVSTDDLLCDNVLKAKPQFEEDNLVGRDYHKNQISMTQKNEYKFQTNYINNVNEDAKEKAKNKYTEVRDQRKKLEDKIATLESRKFDIGKNRESEIVYNRKTVKLSEAQAGLDDEISRLKKELAELK